MTRRMMYQAIAFGLVTLSSFGLYWAEAAWLIYGLLALATAGMVLALRVS